MAWPTPSNRRFRRARQRLHGLVDAIIARRRAQVGEPRDLLDAMIAAAGDRRGRLDDAWLRDEVATLLLAGHETTANALTWTWHLLSQHPDVQQRACRSGAFRRGSGGVRLPAPGAAREHAPLSADLADGAPGARDADVIDGHPIPAGANVALAIWLLHRHPDHWADPERFDPERFRDSQHHGRPGDHYLPFGLGPRTCLGLAFAMHEALIVLAGCLAQLRVQPVADAGAVVPQAGVTLRPRDGLPLAARLARLTSTSRAFSPRTAPAIIRFSAAIDSPPSSVGGMVAKPMAEALG